jgi:hypothetical protein
VSRLQLEAQLHYRLGDNKQAITVYQELFQKHKVVAHSRSRKGFVHRI